MIRSTQRGPRPVVLTRAVADDGTKRDAADRWTTSTVQLSGYDPLSLVRAFDNAGRMASQSGAGFSSAGTYAYAANWSWNCPVSVASSRPSIVGPQVVAAAAASS